MSTIVDPKFMAFLVEVERVFTEGLEKHSISHHYPIGIEITTVDGVAARIYEDGMELYPGSEGDTKA